MAGNEAVGGEREVREERGGEERGGEKRERCGMCGGGRKGVETRGEREREREGGREGENSWPTLLHGLTYQRKHPLQWPPS